MKNFITSERFAATVLVLAILANCHHLATIYHHVSDPPTGIIWIDKSFSYLLVIVMDLAVLYFVAQGRHISAGIYATAVFILSLCYYRGAGIIPDRVVQPLAQFTFSLMLASTVFIFGRTYAEKLKVKEANEVKKLRQGFAQERRSLEEKIQTLSVEMNRYTDTLTCSDCGYVGKSEMSLLAHKKHCKKESTTGQNGHTKAESITK